MIVPFEIDYVFPWVNDMDKVWRETYIEYCKTHNELARAEEMKKERYRDWGLLKFLLRGIAVNMPWIRKLHLIVSNIEQVPPWINQENVHIVLHEQMMPPHCRPTFNSTTIEMFLDNIPDLAEHFIYGNDDIYPMHPSEPSDWFTPEGKPCFNMRRIEVKKILGKQFRVVCAKQWWALQNATHNMVDRTYYRRPWHGLSPLVKSKCKEAKEALGAAAIEASLSAFRTNENMNQYIYTDYMFLTNYWKESNVTFEYCGAKYPRKLLEVLAKSKAQVVCINDCANDLLPRQLATLQVLCAKAFEKRFPNKSKYEN